MDVAGMRGETGKGEKEKRDMNEKHANLFKVP